MPYGRGYGMGGGFRGDYAQWTYIGRGRGGLPRCGYFFANQANLQQGYTYTTPELPVDNLEAMKNAAAHLRNRLAHIQSMISELE